MAEKVVPMIHVPDVRATVDWYQGIGFKVTATYGNEGDGLSFAIVSFGSSEVMFSQGGVPSMQHRREVDLYVYSDDVDGVYSRLKDRVEVVDRHLEPRIVRAPVEAVVVAKPRAQRRLVVPAKDVEGEIARPLRHVYRRAGRACRRCGSVIRSAPQGEHARTAYWCPKCQTGGEPPLAS